MKTKYSKHIVLGYGPDGRPIRKRIKGNSQNELLQNERRARNEYDRANNPSKITFGNYAIKWLETYKAGRAPATVEMYRTKFAHCAPIWKRPFNEVTRSEYQALITAVSDRPNTASKLRLMLTQIIKAGAADGIIPFPSWKLETVKQKAKPVTALSENEMIKIYELPLPLKDRLFVRLIGVYGLRPGEALALSRDSITAEGGLIIDRAVKYDHNNAFIGPTKNGTVRTLPPSEAVAPLLAQYLADFNGFYLFGNNSGELMSKSQKSAYCKRISEQIGVKRLYVLRHSVATKLYYAISPKYGSQLLGNSENVFINTYAHLDLEKEPIINVF